MERVWEIYCEELEKSSAELGLVVHSFVLMSNHFHLLASTPRANISQCMHQFMHRTSRRLTKEGNRINETYAGRHYKCILTRNNHFLNAYKYNYRNPVAAGLCERVEDYRFSTLRGLVAPLHRRAQIAKDYIFDADPLGTLEWLNQPPDPIKLEGVSQGLKRQYFRSKKSRKDRRPLISEDDVL